MSRKEKVYVGLSGGVDSSVSAALLLDEGYDVEGCFIRTWQPDWTPCTWKEDRRDAMRVCARLGIKYNELDLELVYKQEVADYMIREYQAGRTPNPDVMCNRSVKFGGFLDWAMDRGADYVATGHYAQVFETEDGHTVLGRGEDPRKDQSYFLWTLPQEKLKKILFPIGHLEKTEVRSLAASYHLDTAEKKDSQGICFLGEIDMQEFLRHYIDEQPGEVINEAGEVIGRHDGAFFFTLGQRHGFTITEKGTDDAPLYIVGKNIHDNTITVSSSIQERPAQRLVRLESVQCTLPSVCRIGDRVEAVIRYRGASQEAKIVSRSSKSMMLEFATHDPTLAAGQSVVLYLGKVCLGGGVVA